MLLQFKMSPELNKYIVKYLQQYNNLLYLIYFTKIFHYDIYKF